MAQLAKRLGTWDGALLTMGAIIGTGIFMTPGAMAKVLPSAGMLVLAWVCAGIIILAGAVTYAELGTLFPRAGGIYNFLYEAYGPLWGFLYGWTCFAVIMSGGIAAIAMGFAEYFVAFVPGASPALYAIASIVLLTAVNSVGVKGGAIVQNTLTVLKIGSLALFIGLGLITAGPVQPSLTLSAPANIGASFGIAMIAALWAFDGWYAMTFSAGELKTPAKSLPRGMVMGVAATVIIYALANIVYVRALSMADLATQPRAAEAAAAALFGPLAGRLLSMAIVVSAFGCLASTILYSSRLYAPMAEQGLFFRGLAHIHPRFQTPVRSLWAQSAWACVLVLSGTYAQLYTYVTFACVAFHVATGAAVFVLRRRRPELPRPYRAWGYPVVPALFVLASIGLVINTLAESPRESFVGVGLVAVGLVAYTFWRRTEPTKSGLKP